MAGFLHGREGGHRNDRIAWPQQAASRSAASAGKQIDVAARKPTACRRRAARRLRTIARADEAAGADDDDALRRASGFACSCVSKRHHFTADWSARAAACRACGSRGRRRRRPRRRARGRDRARAALHRLRDLGRRDCAVLRPRRQDHQRVGAAQRFELGRAASTARAAAALCRRHHRIVQPQPRAGNCAMRRERWRVLHRVGVLLVGEPPHGDGRVGLACRDSSRWMVLRSPVAAVAAVGDCQARTIRRVGTCALGRAA